MRPRRTRSASTTPKSISTKPQLLPTTFEPTLQVMEAFVQLVTTTVSLEARK